MINRQAASEGAQCVGGQLSLTERALWAFGLGVSVASAAPAGGLWRFPQSVINPWWFPFISFLLVVFSPAISHFFYVLDARITLPRWRLPRVLRWIAIIALLIVTSVLLFRLRSLRFYGDAGAIIKFLEQEVIFHKREPLSPAIYLLVHKTVGQWYPMDARTCIQWVNSIGGAFGLWALARLAFLFSKRQLHIAIVAFLWMASVGAIQLFMGYIENYTLPTVCGLWFFYFGYRAYFEQTSILPAAFLWTLGTAIHLSLMVFLPALFWLAWTQHFKGRPHALLSLKSLSLMVVTLLPSLILMVAMKKIGYLRSEEVSFGGGDGQMFVPLSDTSGKYFQYLFLKEKHLKAILNQQMLVAPISLVACIAASWDLLRSRLGFKKGLLSPPLIFLILAAGGFLTLTVIWHPDLGPFRDWDLFGPVGFYLSVLAAALILHVDRSGRAFALLLFMISVNLSRTLPFVLRNLNL